MSGGLTDLKHTDAGATRVCGSMAARMRAALATTESRVFCACLKAEEERAAAERKRREEADNAAKGDGAFNLEMQTHAQKERIQDLERAVAAAEARGDNLCEQHAQALEKLTEMHKGRYEELRQLASRHQARHLTCASALTQNKMLLSVHVQGMRGCAHELKQAVGCEVARLQSLCTTAVQELGRLAKQHQARADDECRRQVAHREAEEESRAVRMQHEVAALQQAVDKLQEEGQQLGLKCAAAEAAAAQAAAAAERERQAAIENARSAKLKAEEESSAEKRKSEDHAKDMADRLKTAEARARAAEEEVETLQVQGLLISNRRLEQVHQIEAELAQCSRQVLESKQREDEVKRALEDSCQREHLLRLDLEASLKLEHEHKQQSAAAELALQAQLRAAEKSLHGAEVELDRARAREEERRRECEVCEVKWREKEQEWRKREHMLVQHEQESRGRAERLKSECDLARASQEALRSELVQSRAKAQQAALEAERQGLEREQEAARGQEAAAQDIAVLASALERERARLHALEAAGGERGGELELLKASVKQLYLEKEQLTQQAAELKRKEKDWQESRERRVQTEARLTESLRASCVREQLLKQELDQMRTADTQRCMQDDSEKAQLAHVLQALTDLEEENMQMHDSFSRVQAQVARMEKDERELREELQRAQATACELQSEKHQLQLAAAERGGVEGAEEREAQCSHRDCIPRDKIKDIIKPYKDELRTVHALVEKLQTQYRKEITVLKSNENNLNSLVHSPIQRPTKENAPPNPV
jgi:hypothetical protein